MSMIVHSLHGRNDFAPSVAKPCQRPMGLKSHRDVIPHVKKRQGQSGQHTWDTSAISTVIPWLCVDTGRAAKLSTTGVALNPRFFELIALNIFLQSAYYLLDLSHNALRLPSGTNTLLLEWLDAYCETHEVYFQGRINLKNNLTQKGQAPSVYVVRSDQLGDSETGKAFLVQSQDIYEYNLHWGHRGTRYADFDLDSTQHASVLTSCFQSMFPHMVDKANKHINGLGETRLTPISAYHPVTLHNLSRRDNSKHKAKHEGNNASGIRHCTLNEVHMLRSKSTSIEDESIYSRGPERMRLLNSEMECGRLDKTLNLSSFESPKVKEIRQIRDSLMLGRHTLKTGNCTKSERGGLEPPQEGTCSQKDQTAQGLDSLKHQDRSKTSVGKKRSMASSGHPNNEDDQNDSDGDGGISQPFSKRRAKDISSKFACPFFKHDPERYKNTRSCMGPGWANVHRVKEHIFRSHCEPPFKCFRCHSAFKTEDELSGHQRQMVPCEIYAPESQDRHGLSTINADTEKRLKSRKTNKSLTEEERWFNIYHIIFPGHSPPLSPYHSEAEGLIQRFSQSIRPRFEEDLRERLGRAMLNSAVVDDIINEALAALTSVVGDNYDKEGKDSGHPKDFLHDTTFVCEFSSGTTVAEGSEVGSSNSKNLPNELNSLPESINDTLLNHLTTADSCLTDWISATSKPPSDSSSGTKLLSSPLGSGADNEQEKGSAPVPNLNFEDPVKGGTEGPRRTLLREPLLPPNPNTAQSLVPERPCKCPYGNCPHHDPGDSSHIYLESCQGGDQGNDSRDLFASPTDMDIWDAIEQELQYPLSL